MRPMPSARSLMGCDQPHLTAEHLRVLLQAFAAAQTEPSIVASTYAGTYGIPAVFPRSVFQNSTRCMATKARVHCLSSRRARDRTVAFEAAKSTSTFPTILRILNSVQRSMVASIDPCGSSIGTKM